MFRVADPDGMWDGYETMPEILMEPWNPGPTDRMYRSKAFGSCTRPFPSGRDEGNWDKARRKHKDVHCSIVTGDQLELYGDVTAGRRPPRLGRTDYDDRGVRQREA